MSDTSHNWKRGLLKAWLALSLLWAAVLTAYMVWFAADVINEMDGMALIAFAIIVYALPLGIIPCLLVLLLGWIVVALIDRTRRNR